MTNYLEIGNFSSILKITLLTVLGFIASYLTSIGINLPFDAEIIATFLTTIICFGIGYIDMRNPNTFYNSEKDALEIPTELSESQVNYIKELIQYYTETDDTIQQIESVDPSLEYENEGC